jgi:hypothetical protein
MRKTITILLFFAMLCAAACIPRPQNEEDFMINENGTITAYKGQKGIDLVIPARIGGVPVMSIGRDTFKEENLLSVVIPNSVMGIGDEAFSNNQLTSVTIGKGITSIGFAAFSINQLTSVTIPRNVTRINGYAFAYNQLRSVTIGNSVTSINYCAFANNQLSSVTIPSSVSYIGSDAFAGNPLTSVTIGADVTLRHNAFPRNFVNFYNTNMKQAGAHVYRDGKWDTASASVAQNKSNSMSDEKISPQYKGDFLTDKRGTITDYSGRGVAVVIPDMIDDMPVTAVGGGAFLKKQITSVVIPKSAVSIGAYAFAENQLTHIVIPDNITDISNRAFAENQLISIVMSDNLANIGEGAFANNQLDSVAIPDSVSFIGASAFEGNTLTSITIGADVTLRYSAFSEGFVNYYNNKGKKAGTYMYSDGSWDRR